MKELLWGGSEREEIGDISLGGLGYKGIEGAAQVEAGGSTWVVLRSVGDGMEELGGGSKKVETVVSVWGGLGDRGCRTGSN